MGAKNAVKYLAFMLAVVMLFSSCSILQVGEKKAGEEVGSLTAQTVEPSKSSNTAATSSAKTGASSKSGGSSKNSSKAVSSAGGTKKSSTWGSTNCKEIIKKMPTDIAQKGVHVLMWRSYSKGEQAAIDAFENATGCTVRTTVSSKYSAELQLLISQNDSPDVVMIDSDKDWPELAVTSCQPLDKYTFRLDDGCWNKNQMNTMTAKGKTFGVAVTGSFLNEDVNYVVYYFPSVLKSAGITTMPYDLWKSGKWNWDAAHNIAKTFYDKTQKTGIEFLDRDAWADSCGIGLTSYDYKDSKFVNNIVDANKKKTIAGAWSQLSRLNAAGLCSEGFDTKKVGRGDCGMYCSISYGINTENDWFGSVKLTGGVKSIECVPVPAATQNSAYVPFRSKCWGVAKGAKNPEGAAYFLRYFLDPASINQENLYYNAKCKEVFKYITAASTKKNFMCTKSIVNYPAAGQFGEIRNLLVKAPANTTAAVLDNYKGVVTTAVNTSNGIISKYVK
ncbi:MAG: extracellular solute-binding protein [Oscillospiraceae bacterium]|nr:extracellular solute-binding protein [Candidatus Equicaccousia limihippi]